MPQPKRFKNRKLSDPKRYCQLCGGEWRRASECKNLDESDFFAMNIGPGTVICSQCYSIKR